MTNTIDPYNPIFYAQEALIVLEDALGMAARVHRGYDAERKSSNKGDTIQISKPGTFTTQAGATGTAQDLTPTSIDMKLDNWREVKFGLTDKELAYTTEKIITDHLSPATYALAHYIETQLTNLYKYVPWSYDVAASPGANDIVNARKILRDNAGTIVDSAMIHFGIDSTLEAAFLKSEVFHAARIAGDQNMPALLNGSLGNRFGCEHFVQQTFVAHTAGTVVSAKTDLLATVTGNHLKDATALIIGGLSTIDSSDSPAETLAAGDSFVIAGNTQRYTVTAAVTTVAGAATLAIWPQLVANVATGAVVTFETVDSGTFADAYNPNLMFHRNAFAIALAPLPDLGNNAGARMAVATDPRTGLSIRSRLAYDDTNAKVLVTLDVLFGVKCLDPNLAVVARRNA